jgi:hypothetical protein
MYPFFPFNMRRCAVDRLKDMEVASRYYDELESDLQGAPTQSLSLDEKIKKLEETIQRVETNTISYMRKKASKEWFDEECAMVGKQRRQTASHPNQDQRSQLMFTN